MESKGFLIVIHLHIAMISGNYLLDALYTETMLMLVGFGGNQLAPWLVKGIFSAGIYHGNYDKRCFFTFADADFDKRIGAVPGGFHCIVQQVAEQ